MDFQQDFTLLWNKVFDKLVLWMESFFRMLPNLLMALLVVLLFAMLSRWLGGMIDRQMQRFSDQKQLRRMFVNLSRIGILGGGIVIALGILNLDKTVASVLAGVGILGLALGFAFQDIASNFMAGILLIIRKPFRTGDLIESAGFMGRIEEINLRDTVGKTVQGLDVIIPNKDLLGNLLTNYSANGTRRVDLGCGVSYGDDLEQAEKTAIEAIETLEERDREREVEFFYTEFGDSSINFVVRYWVPAEQKRYLRAKSLGIKALKKAFDAKGLTIPFPIRTLDFGVPGGEPLSGHLQALVEKRGQAAKEQG